VAYALKIAPKMKKNQSIVITLSGRGDKDMETIADFIGAKI
jgi:tryptophan synthase beta chain